jgi:Zn-dependent protease
MNLLLAFVSLLLLHMVPPVATTGMLWVADNLYNSGYINVFLAVLNMLPLPPLDGGRVAVAILPRPLSRALASLERSGILILIGLVFLLPMLGSQFGQNWNVFGYIVGIPAEWLHASLARLAGFR